MWVPISPREVNVFLAKAKELSSIDFGLSRYGHVFLDKSKAHSLNNIVLLWANTEDHEGLHVSVGKLTHLPKPFFLH